MTSGPAHPVWYEPRRITQRVSCPRPDEEIQLTPRQLLHFGNPDIIRAGLSPNCRRAFLATRKDIRLITIKIPTTKEPQWSSKVFAQEPLDGIQDAVLSDAYLAVLTSTESKNCDRFGIELYGFSPRRPNHITHIQSLEFWDIEGWVPTCLAIRDSDRDQACPRVVVGGTRGGPEVRLYELLSDEDIAASSSSNTSQLQDSSDSQLKLRHTHFNPEQYGGITGVAFSQDGESIVAVTDASRALIWHIRQIVDGKRTSPIPICIPEDVGHLVRNHFESQS
jgi:hypothetical protein